MYTPSDITIRERIIRDRPYGGWLFGYGIVEVARPEVIDRLELYAGVVGPESRAESTQTWVHRVLTNSPRPRGWRNQIGTFAGVNLVYTHRRLIREGHVSGDVPIWDLTTTGGGALGNVFTYGSVGSEFRVGYNLPSRFFSGNLSAMQASVPAERATVFNSSFRASRPQWDSYVFVSGEGRGVIRNAFIDEAPDRQEIERRPWVGDVRIGLSVRWRILRVAYVHTVRSAEFRPDNRSHSFGAAVISIGTAP